MGGFPFLTKAVGSTLLTKPNENQVIKLVSNGNVWGERSNKRDEFWHYRIGLTNNPVITLPGSATKWRNPSSYRREGYRKESVISGKFKLGPSQTYYVEDSHIDRTDTNVQFGQADTNPFFTPGSLTSIKLLYHEVENSRARAEAKALSDLASSKASMGENLAQLNQTVNLFGTIAEASIDVLRAYRGLRRGQIPNLASLNVRKIRKMIYDRKIERRVANYWLAYWYGFKPLVSDAYGIYELMLEQSKPALLVHGRGRSAIDNSQSFSAKTITTLAPKLQFQDMSSIVHQCHLTGRLRSDGVTRLFNRVGLLNVPSIAWDLIPFSFVVDWGVPVGQFLSNLSASAGLTFVGGSATVRFERELTVTVDPQWQMGESPLTHLWGFGMDRQKLSKFPRGSLYSKPFFTGSSRLATIGALLSNLTRR